VAMATEEKRALSVGDQHATTAKLARRYENTEIPTTSSIAINVCANIHLNKSTL